MILFKPDKNIFGNTLEIHFWFNDESHSMNAAVQNRCEYEVLGLIQEVSKVLAVHIEIETEPFGEGGLKKWLKFVKKMKRKTQR